MHRNCLLLVWIFEMVKTTGQRRKTIKNIEPSVTPKIREIGIMKLRRNPKRGKNSQPSQSPPIFRSSDLGALYEAINFNATSQTVEPRQKAPADSQIGKDRVSPPLFDDSEPNDLEAAPSPTQEQTKAVKQSVIDVEMTLKTPSPPIEMKGIGKQYSDSSTQTEPPELPTAIMVDASTNTAPHGSDASTNTENVDRPMPVMQPEQDEFSESEYSGSDESETDLDDFLSDISSIAEDIFIPTTAGSEPDDGSVCGSPPRTLAFVNQQFHSPESAKLLNNDNDTRTSA